MTWGGVDGFQGLCLSNFTSGTNGSTTPSTSMQPYLVVNCIIKA